MKNLYACIIGMCVLFSATAQNNNIQQYPFNIQKHVLNTGLRTSSDTLMYMPLVDVYINPTDNSWFTIEMEDIDMLTPYNAGVPMDFGLFYSIDTTVDSYGQPTQNNFYHPWENPVPLGNDSAFFWGATSYFNPPGQANNWLMFGPLTIPSTGATLIWYDKTKFYKDGYEVLVGYTSAPHSYIDFTSPPIYSEPDVTAPSPTLAIDTTWEYKSIVIPSSYNGQVISFAFHHNANAMDVLFLDEITLVKNGGTCDASFTVVQDTSNLYNYTVYNTSSTGSNYYYLWDFGDTTTSNLQYPMHNYSGSGPYQLCLTVTDTSGCSDTQCDSIYAGRSSGGISLVVLPPIITNVKETKLVNLLNIYPNPTNTISTISYSIGKDTSFELTVFDLLGNKVTVIETGNRKAGNYSTVWNAENLSKGMYLLQLKTDDTISVKKVIISR